MKDDPVACWCGAEGLDPFSPDYLRCPACETLVSRQMPAEDPADVADDEQDFYGRQYWFAYQETELAHPNILRRARTDLPERCLHWLRVALRYALPPARVLEVGSGHGGFVALLRAAGFDATGLELSPWVVAFAREAFGVPVLCGPIERQSLAPGSFRMIALMDVLEHLRDPLATVRRCLALLDHDGVLLVQTPCYPEGRSHAEMLAAGDRFLECLVPKEHLYLFSRRSVAELCRRAGAEHLVFEPPVFPEYDMFPVVSRRPPRSHGVEAVEQALSGTPGGRLVQALLDLGAEIEALRARYAEAERDRADRLAVIVAQGDRLGVMDAARQALVADVAALRDTLERVEADRAARLEVIHQQGRALAEAQATLAAQGEALREAQAAVAVHEQHLTTVSAQMRRLQRVVTGIQRSRGYRLLRALGRWRFVEDALGAPPGKDQ